MRLKKIDVCIYLLGIISFILMIIVLTNDKEKQFIINADDQFIAGDLTKNISKKSKLSDQTVSSFSSANYNEPSTNKIRANFEKIAKTENTFLEEDKFEKIDDEKVVLKEKNETNYSNNVDLQPTLAKIAYLETSKPEVKEPEKASASENPIKASEKENFGITKFFTDAKNIVNNKVEQEPEKIASNDTGETIVPVSDVKPTSIVDDIKPVEKIESNIITKNEEKKAVPVYNPPKKEISTKPNIQSKNQSKKLTPKLPIKIKKDIKKEKCPNPKEKENKKSKISKYKVKSGDCVWKIAQKFKANSSKIIKVNKLLHPNLLQVGQTLVIPLLNL